MAKLIKFNTFKDERGFLTVIEKELDFQIQRVFYIYGTTANQERGGHGHIKNRQILISLHGSCVVNVKKRNYSEEFLLDSPQKGLLLEPEDWHEMKHFENENVLLVLASMPYDSKDYFTTPEN